MITLDTIMITINYFKFITNTAKYFKFCNKMVGHLWKVYDDSKDKGGQDEGCSVQGARVSDVSEIIIFIFQ